MLNTKQQYTRIITPAPRKPVERGRPLFGSYSGMFHNFDIRGLKNPYGRLPSPSFITDLRVIDTLRLVFCDEHILGAIEFFYGGYFSYMETMFWLRQTNRQFAYRQILPAGFMHLPHYIPYSVAACRVRRRYVRLFSRLSKGMLHADFDFLGSRGRPTCEGRLDFDACNPECTDYSAVIPYFVNRRCEAVYLRSFRSTGWISFGSDWDIQLDKKTAAGFLDFRQAYIGLRTRRAFLIGLGYLDGVQVSFQLSDSTSTDKYAYNDNMLFFGGKRIPLPPVRISRPYGSGEQWIIQDTENMVDLTFNPATVLHRKLNAFVCKTDYKIICGTFDGFFLTPEGQEIKLKAFTGLGKRIRMRI